MKHIHTFKRLSAIALAIAIAATPAHVAASSWSPTLLVNTEAFQTIDDGDGSTDIELRFGTTGNELKLNVTTNLFEFDSGIEVAGTASGRAVHAQDLLTTSGSLVVEENQRVSLNGISYLFPSSDGTNGFVLTTDSSGNLTWTNKTAGSLTQGSADDRYLRLSGGTVTGAVLVDVGDGNESNTPDGGIALEVAGVLSGETLHFGNKLTGSGTVRIQNVTDSTTSFQVLDADGGAPVFNIDTTNERIGVGTATPEATVDVVGTISGTTLYGNDAVRSSGSLMVDGDSFLDGEVTFGSGIIINGVTYIFPFGDGSASGKVLATDGSGNLSWTDGSSDFTLSADGGADQTVSGGDTLEVAGGDEITTTASATDTVTINITDDTVDFTELEDTLDLDASTTINFGANNFDFNLDSTGEFRIFGTASGTRLHADTALTSSGTLSVDGAATFRSTVTLSALTSCSLLTTDANGQLACDSEGFAESVDDQVNTLLQQGSGITLDYDDTNGTLIVGQGFSSGAQVSLSPEYAGAVYNPDGSNNVGQLVLDYDDTNKENFYKWNSTQSSLQDYDIAVRVKIPDEFTHWDGTAPIQFRYRTNAASADDNQMDVTMLDTANSAVALTGGADLANTSWTTATITGPESTGTYTPGSYITLLIKMQARTTNTGEAHAGYINFNWMTRAR